MTTTYHVWGSVRGGCGHNHRTIRGAVTCLLRDQRGCASQGGYSDRGIVAYENLAQRPLTENEQDVVYEESQAQQ